jgi:predicted AAA+ superfamily ATPase
MAFHDLSKLSKDLLHDVKDMEFVRTVIFAHLEPPKQNAVIVKGARGIGKSTVIKQYLSEKQKSGYKVLYFSADSSYLDSRLVDLAMEYNDRGGEYLAIDEIHRYTGDWQRELKTIIDSFPRLKLIVSGSSALKLDYAKADLSRRHLLIKAKGISFREYLKLNLGFDLKVFSITELLKDAEEICHVIRKIFADQKLDLLQSFHDYLRSGYFLTRNNYTIESIYFDSLVNTINSVIDSDIPYIHHDVDPVARDKIKTLLKHIAIKCPFTPNISEVAQNLGLSNDNTLKKYLFYLHEAEILLNLYPSNKSHKDFPKPQKIFLNNTNFAFAFSSEPNIGTLRETYVANCLYGLGELTAPTHGDFCLDNIIFEVGGKSKSARQIKDIQYSYVLADNILGVNRNIIPLWLLGFLW